MEIQDAFDKVPAWRFTQPTADKPKAHRSNSSLNRRQLRALPFAEKYAIYMRSKMWFRFRSRIFQQRGAKCEECPVTERLELHHLTYKRLCHERPEDVKILCLACHAKAHQLLREMRQGK